MPVSQPSAPDPRTPTAPNWLPSLVIGGFALLLIEAGAMVVGAWGPLDGTFKGPDSYMRLLRVLECAGGPGCSDGVLLRSNAPAGEALHWPWLWDWVLLLLSAPFRLFMGDRAAVVTAGYLVGPLLGLCTILLLTLAAGKARVAHGLAYVGLLAMCQPYVTFLFAYTRPDHHGVQAAIFSGGILSAAAILSTGRLAWARAFGVLFGLGVWISTEGLISALPLLSAIGVWWTVSGGADKARLNLEWTSWATLTALIAVVIDGPLAGWSSVEFDRISVVHVVLLALMAGFWATALGWESRAATGAIPRWVHSFAGAAVAFGVMAVVFPGFHRGPAADMAEPLWTLWLHHTAEYVPLIRRSDAIEILVAATPFLLAAPLALWAALREHTQRWTWGMVLGCLVWFQMLGTFQQVRWATYVHLLGALPLAWFLGGILSFCARIQAPLLAAAARVGAVVTVALAPVTLTAIVGLSAGRRDYGTLDACEPGEVIRALNGLAGPTGGPVTILAPIFWGPEILFRTPHSVVATPYHRNPGILASYDIMAASPDSARDLLVDRGITHIAWCPGLNWLPYVNAEESPETLFGHLVASEYPSWLQPLPQPSPQVRIGAVSTGVAETQLRDAAAGQN
ncbi:MAG: hypothetical protein HKN73_01510 [Gemmatimonadetes bacterium]|nr:hypothetical protein [Gemmatimonadota bacterium]